MTEPARSKKKTWIWVVVGLLIVAAVAFAAFVGIVAMTVMRDLKVERPTAAEADRVVEEQRQRFADAPLLEIAEDGGTRREELDRRMAGYSGAPPTSMRVLAWDEREGKLVRLSIPFWVIRLSSGRNFQVDLEGVQLRDVEVTAEELERAGPALVLDYTLRGTRVLVWTE